MDFRLFIITFFAISIIIGIIGVEIFHFVTKRLYGSSRSSYKSDQTFDKDSGGE